MDMKKNFFYALMMPALLLGAVACTDYQDDIDKLAAENDALRSYNNQTISRLNSMVFQTEKGVNRITVDPPKSTVIVYEMEPKDLASTLAADLSRLSFETQNGGRLDITAAAGNDELGTLTVTATPSGFDGGKTQSASLVYSEAGRSYKTAYAPIYVVTRPTALEIGIASTISGKYAVGEQYQLKAIYTPVYTTEKDVLWSSSNTDLATIDENGLLTPKANGTVEITVTSAENAEVKASITIIITGSNIPLNENGKSQKDAE